MLHHQFSGQTFTDTLAAYLEQTSLFINLYKLLFFQVGWSASSNQGFGEAPGIKKQVLDIIRSVRTVMRIPLIFINSLVIVKKLVLG